MALENSNELIIKIRDLKMNFGTKEVLKGINLDIHKGEIIGYIGTNVFIFFNKPFRKNG